MFITTLHRLYLVRKSLTFFVLFVLFLAFRPYHHTYWLFSVTFHSNASFHVLSLPFSVDFPRVASSLSSTSWSAISAASKKRKSPDCPNVRLQCISLSVSLCTWFPFFTLLKHTSRFFYRSRLVKLRALSALAPLSLVLSNSLVISNSFVISHHGHLSFFLLSFGPSYPPCPNISRHMPRTSCSNSSRLGLARLQILESIYLIR